MRNKLGQLLVGAVLLFYGGVHLTSRIMGYDLPFFFDGWWTLLVMVPAGMSMLETGIHIGNTIVLLLGALLLCWEQGWIENLNFPLVLAVVLVVLGVYFIARAISGMHKKPRNNS